MAIHHTLIIMQQKIAFQPKNDNGAAGMQSLNASEKPSTFEQCNARLHNHSGTKLFFFAVNQSANLAWTPPSQTNLFLAVKLEFWEHLYLGDITKLDNALTV